MSTAAPTKKSSSLSLFREHVDYLLKQIKAVLPSHMTPDRMARLAMTAWQSSDALQKCSMESLASSILMAAQMGLEIGVGGHGWIIPYKGKASFVPGWLGLVDLMNRSKMATVWTGAVYEEDSFDWILGDSPFVKHKPSLSPKKKQKLIATYSIGRVHGADFPIIEVWSSEQVIDHREHYNKVGKDHYSYTNENNFEMYARKVALLQVLKYLPKSAHLQLAVDASAATEQGKTYTIDAESMTVVPDADPETPPEEKGLRGKMQESKVPESKSESEPESQADEEEFAIGLSDFMEMAAEAESEAACRSIGRTVARSGLSEADKSKVQKSLAARAKELLGSPNDSVNAYMQRIEKCKEASRADAISVSIENDETLSVDQKSKLIDMLNKKFAGVE